MDQYEISRLIEKHGNYRYIFMTESQLREELKGWCRQDLINWLKWNDPNGIYDDKQSIAEVGRIMSYEEGVQIMINQIHRIRYYLGSRGDSFNLIDSRNIV